MRQFYTQYEYVMAATQLVLAMLGIGLTLTPKDFKNTLLYPRSLTLGMALQMLLAPLFAFLVLKSGSVSLGVVTGLILCATAPGGSASNIFTHVARGNTSLSVSMTVLTSVICVVSIPFLLEQMINDGSTMKVAVPVERIGLEIGGFLLTPLLLGMGILKLLPIRAAALSKWCVRVSLAIIALMITTALTSGRMDLKAFGAANIAIVLAFMLSHILGTMLLTKAAGMPRADITAVVIETAVRNGSLALMIKASLIPSDSVKGVDYVLFTVMLYTGLQSLMALVLVPLGRRFNAGSSAPAGEPFQPGLATPAIR